VSAAADPAPPFSGIWPASIAAVGALLLLYRDS